MEELSAFGDELREIVSCFDLLRRPCDYSGDFLVRLVARLTEGEANLITDITQVVPGTVIALDDPLIKNLLSATTSLNSRRGSHSPLQEHMALSITLPTPQPTNPISNILNPLLKVHTTVLYPALMKLVHVHGIELDLLGSDTSQTYLDSVPPFANGTSAARSTYANSNDSPSMTRRSLSSPPSSRTTADNSKSTNLDGSDLKRTRSTSDSGQVTPNILPPAPLLKMKLSFYRKIATARSLLSSSRSGTPLSPASVIDISSTRDNKLVLALCDMLLNLGPLFVESLVVYLSGLEELVKAATSSARIVRDENYRGLTLRKRGGRNADKRNSFIALCPLKLAVRYHETSTLLESGFPEGSKYAKRIKKSRASLNQLVTRIRVSCNRCSWDIIHSRIKSEYAYSPLETCLEKVVVPMFLDAIKFENLFDNRHEVELICLKDPPTLLVCQTTPTKKVSILPILDMIVEMESGHRFGRFQILQPSGPAWTMRAPEAEGIYWCKLLVSLGAIQSQAGYATEVADRQARTEILKRKRELRREDSEKRHLAHSICLLEAGDSAIQDERTKQQFTTIARRMTNDALLD